MSDLSGQTIGKYTIQALIKQDWISQTYSAQQQPVGRMVLVKVLQPQARQQYQNIVRLEGEARLLSQLEHPHIITLLDYVHERQVTCLVMRYYALTLREEMERKRLKLASIADLLRQIARALTFMHRKNIVHANIKPDNILIDEDHNFFLADFSIARDLSLPIGEDPPGIFSGTPAYVAPEQILGEGITPRTDIYSLGVMLFELLTGQVPFQGEFRHIALAHLNDELPSLGHYDFELAYLLDEAPHADKRAHLPDAMIDALNEVLHTATAKKPQDRYADVSAMVQAFEAALKLEQTAPQPPQALPPQPSGYQRQIGPYDIVDVLGRGGMGDVYQAIHRDLKRPAAVKILPQDLAQQSSFRERFKQEARSIARLHHPNIVQIYDTGEFNGLYYIAMELINGPDLEQYRRRVQRMSLKQLRPLVQGLAAALDYAHENKVIHRDIKPSNILLQPVRGTSLSFSMPYQAVLTDFGLAKVIGATADFTTSGHIMGTAQYMAPEQIDTPQLVDKRVDIYALGTLVYQLLTGELPFKGDNQVAVIYAKLRDEPPDPRRIDPSLPDEAARAIMKAMAKTPAHRFDTAAEFVNILKDI